MSKFDSAYSVFPKTQLFELCVKRPRIYIFAYHFANVGMKPGAILQFFMYLCNKNILEYAQIAQSEPKSMIHNIEGHSNK